jgi:hypothetical protein
MDPDPGGPKARGSGSATLNMTINDDISRRQLRFAAECVDTSCDPAASAAGIPWTHSHSLPEKKQN